MLRREADGAAWALRRAIERGERPSGPLLHGEWVTRGDPAATSDLLWAVAAAVESIQTLRRLRMVLIDGFDVRLKAWTPQWAAAVPYALEGLAPGVTLIWAGVSLGVHRFESAEPWQWELTCWTEFGTPPDGLAEAWAGIHPLMVRMGPADWGGIYFDRRTELQTPHEAYLGIEDGVATAQRHPRHYAWSNLLTAHHLAGLGGLLQRARQYGLRVTGAGDGAAIVDAGVALSAFDDERLAAMKAFLDPVLRNPPYRWYAGLPLRVVKEPGTACKPLPPDTTDPTFDDD